MNVEVHVTILLGPKSRTSNTTAISKRVQNEGVTRKLLRVIPTARKRRQAIRRDVRPHEFMFGLTNYSIPLPELLQLVAATNKAPNQCQQDNRFSTLFRCINMVGEVTTFLPYISSNSLSPLPKAMSEWTTCVVCGVRDECERADTPLLVRSWQRGPSAQEATLKRSSTSRCDS